MTPPYQPGDVIIDRLGPGLNHRYTVIACQRPAAIVALDETWLVQYASPSGEVATVYVDDAGFGPFGNVRPGGAS